jgi:predicted dehydrogenase
MVNVGWGYGPGGVAVHGTNGRAIASYRAGGTMPWAPFEQLTVTTADGTRIVDLPPGQDLVPLVADAMRDTVVDLADAIGRGGTPAADGAAALHTLETTVAAYASAALSSTVAVPLSADGPLYRSGVVGVRALDVPESSLVRRRGLFGLTPAGA